MDECIYIAKKMKQLEENGDVKVVYADLESTHGLCIEKNEQYLIVINSKLNYESQVATAWHEAKHICSHIGCSHKNKIEIEKEAIDFSKQMMNNLELCRNAW